MESFDDSEALISEPPASGLDAYARLQNARALVRRRLRELKTRLAEGRNGGALTQEPSAKFMVDTLALVQWYTVNEEARLARIDFPMMETLQIYHETLLDRLRCVETALTNDLTIAVLQGAAEEAHRYAEEYFDWLDETFCRPPRVDD